MKINLNTLFDDGDILDEWWIERMRNHRNRLLAQSDWTQVADAPVDQQAWATYRQALRDFPATWTAGPEADFPDTP
jgi:aminoglycoside/choline kinase family phosphotransferase